MSTVFKKRQSAPCHCCLRIYVSTSCNGLFSLASRLVRKDKLSLPYYYLCYYSTATYTRRECRCNSVNRVDSSLIGIVISIHIKVVCDLYNSAFFSHSSSSLYVNTPEMPCPVRSHSDMNPHLPYEALIALHTIPFFSGDPLTKILTSIVQSLFHVLLHH